MTTQPSSPRNLLRGLPDDAQRRLKAVLANPYRNGRQMGAAGGSATHDTGYHRVCIQHTSTKWPRE
jgi:hypothetical protein